MGRCSWIQNGTDDVSTRHTVFNVPRFPSAQFESENVLSLAWTPTMRPTRSSPKLGPRTHQSVRRATADRPRPFEQGPAWERGHVSQLRPLTVATSGTGLFSIRAFQHIIVWQRSQPRVKSRWNPEQKPHYPNKSCIQFHTTFFHT